VADAVKAVDHKYIVTPRESAALKITSRGMQTQIIVQCPHCLTDKVAKYGCYKTKQITYYRCSRCTVADPQNPSLNKRRRPFTFPVQQVWR
jgi:hypothetical protein